MKSTVTQYPDHPTASLMPAMTEEEFQALKADIKRHGLREPVLIFNGQVVDGRHRLRVCRELGIEPQVKEMTCQEQDLPGLVRSLNFHRRHLTREQKQAIIRQQLKETPDKSDRQIARDLGVSDKTVGSARKVLEATAEIPQFDTAVGADGKARKRPVARVDLGLLESLGSAEKMTDVLVLIKKNKIPEKFHKSLIEKAQGWAPNSKVADREGTSISVKGGAWWHVASGRAAQVHQETKADDFRRRTRSKNLDEFSAELRVKLMKVTQEVSAGAPYAHLIGKDTLKSALLKAFADLKDSVGKFEAGLLRPLVGEKEIRTESPAQEYLPSTLDEGDNASIPF